MLNQEELNNLFTIISDENKTFENVGNLFHKVYQKQDQFKVGVTLWYLLKDDLLNLSQRLASFYIFYDIYKNDCLSYSPFMPIILETLETSQNNIEKKFLSEFVSTGQVKNTKITINNYIEENKHTEDINVPDLKQCWQIFNAEKEKYSSLISNNSTTNASTSNENSLSSTFSNDWIRPILYESEKGAKMTSKSILSNGYSSNLSSSNINTNSEPFNFTNLSKEELSFNYFEPYYMTLYPNNESYPLFDDEPIWVMPGLNFEFLWDFTLSPEQNTIKALLNKISTGKPISEEQEKIVLDTIQENNKILYNIKFTPENLFKIIESNPKFAGDIYIRICKADFFKDYLEIFLNRSSTIYSLEVINRIFQYIELPWEFINKFIKNLVQTKKPDKQKTRSVRIVAIFITNLIDHDHFSFKGEVPSYLEDFFKEYGKEKEVDALRQKIQANNK